MKALVVGDVIDDILVSPLGPIRTNTDTKASILQSPGGSAANFACWLAKDMDVNFVGRVNHKDIDRHSEVLRSYGVVPKLQSDPDLPTGTIVVLIEGESRTFLTDRGANQNLEVEKIADEDFGDLLYLSGYSLLSLEADKIQTLISRAHKLGALVACDPGSSGFIQDFGVKRFLDSLEGVDILLPNLEEGRLLSGEDRPELICGFLAERFNIVALTMGQSGCAVQQGDAYFKRDAIAADVVDPTGAGDAFASGFLASFLRRETIDQACLGAIKQGSRAVTLPGGRPKI